MKMVEATTPHPLSGMTIKEVEPAKRDTLQSHARRS